MNFAVVQGGRIVRTFTFDGPAPPDCEAGAVPVPAGVTALTHYLAAGVPTPIPPEPGPHHAFDFDAGVWVRDLDAAWAAVRRDRDTRLAATDWRVVRAQESRVPVPPEWIAYRQALRDVTQQGDPEAIEWPVEPS